MTTAPAKTLTVAITGASGVLLARTLLRTLVADVRVARVHLVPSEASLRVLAEELNVHGRNHLAERLLGAPSEKIHLHAPADIGAPIASGSYPTDGMIVLPCSMGTLASIAQGTAETLIARAADVCLKERRTLLLCLRETPFNKIHLRNMSLAADAGAVIFPVIPAFYNHPVSVEDMAQHFVERVLAHIGLAQPRSYQWPGNQE